MKKEIPKESFYRPDSEEGVIAEVFSAVHNLLTEKEKDLASISVGIEDV